MKIKTKYKIKQAPEYTTINLNLNTANQNGMIYTWESGDSTYIDGTSIAFTSTSTSIDNNAIMKIYKQSI